MGQELGDSWARGNTTDDSVGQHWKGKKPCLERRQAQGLFGINRIRRIEPMRNEEQRFAYMHPKAFPALAKIASMGPRCA